MIHALPGMGADRRMFPGPWLRLPSFVAHDWVRHAGEKSLPEVARSVCAQFKIRDGDVLVGASLGGMVACEISKLRDLRALYLVGSATRQEEVNALLAKLHPLAQIAPIDWLKFSAGKIPIELTQMFAGLEATFIRAMCAAVFHWEGLGQTSAHVFRLHGKFDLVIPPSDKVDLLVNGGHLISISHAEDCVRFIERSLELKRDAARNDAG